MTTVLIDVGNARLKWALAEGGAAGATQIAATRVADLTDGAQAALQALAQSLTDEVESAVIGNVAGAPFGAQLARMLEREPRIRVWFARSLSESCGVRCAYAQPQTLGVDRWAAIVAGFRRARSEFFGDPICIVDAGTAVTIDAVTARGAHLGGLILPGLRLQTQALLSAAAEIRVRQHTRSRVPQGVEIFADNTSDAVAYSGPLACSAAIDRCVRTLAGDSNNARLLLTGGDAARLLPWLETRAEICPNLVFEGLAMLYEQRMAD